MSNIINPNYKYSDREQYFIDNIHSLELYDLLRKEKNLSFEFVMNYLMNDKYHVTCHEKDMHHGLIPIYQTHLKQKLYEYMGIK